MAQSQSQPALKREEPAKAPLSSSSSSSSSTPPPAHHEPSATEKAAAVQPLLSLCVQAFKALSDNQPTLGLTVFVSEMKHYYDILNPPPPPPPEKAA